MYKHLSQAPRLALFRRDLLQALDDCARHAGQRVCRVGHIARLCVAICMCVTCSIFASVFSGGFIVANALQFFLRRTGGSGRCNVHSSGESVRHEAEGREKRAEDG